MLITSTQLAVYTMTKRGRGAGEREGGGREGGGREGGDRE